MVDEVGFMRTSSTRDEATGVSRAESPVPAATLVGAVRTYGSGPGAVRALNGVDVAFGAGAFTAVMGPSGSGKSTLLHCGVGLDRLTEGTALIGETDLGALRDRELTLLRRTRVGFVFQAFNLIPSLSARENITLPLDLAGRAPDQAFFDELTGALGLSSRLHHRPSELSGGQQQRVAVARALLGRPDIVFADEPTGNLDSRAGAEVLAFLQHAARERGQSIVMVTHDPVAAAYADRAVFLSDGNLVADLAAPTRDSVLAELSRATS
jgi:putative ABC transport system ATP-binding protein